MDLIYTGADRKDIGVLHDYALDLAYGSDENDFELTMDANNHCCNPNYFIYIEGTEYGGIIDKIGVVTTDEKLTYMGRTWHGILASKVIEPNEDGSPLTVSGKASVVLKELVERIGLSDLFTVLDDGEFGLTIIDYTFDPYVDGYTGFTKMVASASGKLKFSFTSGQVVLSALPIVDYSKDEQFDNDNVEMEIEKIYNSINHLICVGKKNEDDKDKEDLPVVHLYKDWNGIFNTEAVCYIGVQEIVAIYEYSNYDDLKELLEEVSNGNMEKLESYITEDKVQMNFESEETMYDLGDIIGATEVITGTSVIQKITKKIVTINQGMVNIQYKVGE